MPINRFHIAAIKGKISKLEQLIKSEEWAGFFDISDNGETVIDYLSEYYPKVERETLIKAIIPMDQKLTISLWALLKKSDIDRQIVLTAVRFFLDFSDYPLRTDQIIYLFNVLIEEQQTELLFQFFLKYKPKYFLMSTFPDGFDKNILVKVCSLPNLDKINYGKLLIYFINRFYSYCNVQDEKGKTALHWLAIRGYEDLIEFIIEKNVPGVDLNIRDHNNKVPSDYAKDNQHEISYQKLKKSEREANDIFLSKSYYTRACQSLFSGNTAKAIKLCQEALEIFPNYDFYHRYNEECLNTYKVYLYILLGRAKLENGNGNEAIKNYLRALKLESDLNCKMLLAEIYFYMYEAYRQLSNDKKAQEFYLKGLECCCSIYGGRSYKYVNEQSFLKYAVKKDLVDIVKTLLRIGIKPTEDIYETAIRSWEAYDEQPEVLSLLDYTRNKGGLTLYEYIQLYPDKLINIATIIKDYEFFSLDSLFKKINAQQLIDHIERLIKHTDNVTDYSVEEVSGIKRDLNAVNFYLQYPDFVVEAIYKGGVIKIKQTYASELLRLSLLINYDKKLTVEQAKKITVGMTLLAQTYKVKRAYTDILKAKKYLKAGLPKFDDAHPISQINPIMKLSGNNITRLKNDLGHLSEDEVDLYAELLKLPYKLQHATNDYYRISNAGSLDSYTEIKRRDPGYVSKFSTGGNIEKLSNGGFIFFRLYVDPVNGNETRYGDSTLNFKLQLLRQCGWVSLHDQLKPFTNKKGQRTEKSLNWDNYKFLRISKEQKESKSIESRSDLSYGYRQTSIQKNTAKKNMEFIYKKRSFLEEIFFGKDILLGIALSVIRELRYLNICGFRQYFLSNFNSANKENKTILLGDLIKKLFHIEGKYPAALQLEVKLVEDTQYFIPIAKTDRLKLSDRKFEVINPDGDGRYNRELKLYPDQMKMAELRDSERSFKSLISGFRQQKKRKRAVQDEAKIVIYDEKISQLQNELNNIKRILLEEKNKKQKLINGFVKKHSFMKENDFVKYDTRRLELLAKVIDGIEEMPNEDLLLLEQFIQYDIPTLCSVPINHKRTHEIMRERIESYEAHTKDNAYSQKVGDKNSAKRMVKLGFHSLSKNSQSSGGNEKTSRATLFGKTRR